MMSDSSINETKLTPKGRRSVLLYMLGISIFCLLLYSAINVLINWPRYIEVSIDLPGDKDWSYADRSIRAWDDGPKYFIWRRETDVYKHAPDNFYSQEAVIEYIDRQLVSKGWHQFEYNGWFPCDSVLPESNFLEWGNTYRGYTQQNSNDIKPKGATLCVAVWPIDNYDGFHLVIMTENPSLLTRLGDDFD